MSGVVLSTKIELSGNFFARDPGRTLYTNIGHMLEGLSHELESVVRDDIQAHASAMPGYSGWSRDHVHGYTTSPTTGKHWAVWAAVGSVTAGMDRRLAIRTKAAAATIEARWHPYRRVKSAVYRSRALISADLAKGLE
jgi:hypothetical protein